MAEPTPALLRRLGHAWHSLAHSLRLRLVALFLLLALAMSAVFFGGMQKALSIGWRDAARPLMADYVARLAAEVGDPPSVEQAEALVRRLPLSVRIHGPQVNWQSHADWHRSGPGPGPRLGAGRGPAPWGRHDGSERDPLEERGPPLLEHITRDGHRIEFGLSVAAWEHQPRRVIWVMLAALLVLTGLAYAYVRYLLRPLDDIGSGARRFGRGEFGQLIGLKRKDELGDLAREVDKMAQDIHGMLEAKRALLLAISHELRSPLTRARLNTELLPDGTDQPDVAARREALLRDLALMRDLVTDLLESERLASAHAALHLAPTDVTQLVHEVLSEWPDAAQGAPRVSLDLAPDLPSMPLDASRLRLLLRNLLDNALRHSAGVDRVPIIRVAQVAGEGGASNLEIVVRDFGPGVEESALAHLAEPFYRPDSARQRATGGVGLGLHLCKLVAQAHRGTLTLRNAQPGLEARVVLPLR